MNRQNKAFQKIFYITYSLLMIISYFAYVFLESYRMNKSDYWLSKPNLTQQDFNNIEIVASWVLRLEVLILLVFIIGLLIVIFFFYDRIMQIKIFLVLNAGLFSLSVCIGLLFYSSTLTLGNILQPVLLPLLGVFLVGIYLLWLHKGKRR